MYSNTLSFEDCNQVLKYYNIQSQSNIFKTKKKAHHIVMTKMCCHYDVTHRNKYNHIINVIRKHRMYSYNKKNLHQRTMKSGKNLFHNRTNATSPISWMLTI
jgi:hypothetical protein